MKIYRARAWRSGPENFDPLDSSGSVAGLGWRYNDVHTEILYASEVEALAVLEVAVRPVWETVKQVVIATIEIPDGCVTTLEEMSIALPRNWHARPAAADARSVGREFLSAIASIPAARRPMALRVPSVLSRSDFNVLVDPARKSQCSAFISNRIPFSTLLNAKT